MSERSRFGSVYHDAREGRWYARFPNGRRTPSGRASYDVRPVPNEAAGWRFLKEVAKARRLGTLRDDGPSRRQGAETLAEAVESYLAACESVGRAAGTLAQYRITLKAVRASGLGEKPALRVTADDVRAFLAWRRSHVWSGRAGSSLVPGRTASNAVLFRDRGLLACVYTWLVREGRATANPCAKVAPPKKPETHLRPFENEEVGAFLDACGPHLRSLVVAGFYCGQGGRELVGVRWRDVSFPRRTLSFVRQKTGKNLVVPMHPELERELRGLREERTREGGIPGADAHVFLNTRGVPYRSFPLRAWHVAVERAGLKGRGLTPHSLRRTFATAWTGAERDLQALLGHASLNTTLLYRRTRPERQRAGVEALDYSTRPAAPIPAKAPASSTA